MPLATLVPPYWTDPLEIHWIKKVTAMYVVSVAQHDLFRFLVFLVMFSR